jgi:2-(1,2-epoxy-1,2-dihydrophenyl)acetyl-CoA isomerase
VDVSFQDGVATIRLARPDNANAIDMQLGRELLDASMRCRDQAVRAVVIAGSGRNFCFGGDLKAMARRGDETAAPVFELATLLHAAIAQFVRLDAPVIAAVNGTAAGAGLSLVLMADLAIAAASARFASAYTAVGLTPDGGMTFLLPRAVGRKRAIELLMINRMLNADEALEWGLINRVVADEDLQDAAQAVARQLGSGPRSAFGSIKRLIADAQGDFEAQLARESHSIARAAEGAEGREGMRAFIEKRKPDFISAGIEPGSH